MRKELDELTELMKILHATPDSSLAWFPIIDRVVTKLLQIEINRAGVGLNPVAEHYMDGFERARVEGGFDQLQVNDC